MLPEQVTCLQRSSASLPAAYQYCLLLDVQAPYRLLLQEQEAVQADASGAFPPVNKEVQLQHSLLGKAYAEDVTEHYEIGRVLGNGHCGTTRIALHKMSGQTFACKSIKKNRYILRKAQGMPR